MKPVTVDLDALDKQQPTGVAEVKKPKDDPFAIADWHGIRPQWFYRKTHPETRRIIGHKSVSSINEAIADGTLPPLVPLTAKGRACGWYGFQLVDYVKRRMDAATERAKALSDPNRPKHPGGRPRKAKAAKALPRPKHKGGRPKKVVR